MIVDPTCLGRLTKFTIISRSQTQIDLHIPVTKHDGFDSVVIPAGGQVDALVHENVDIGRLNDLSALKRLRDTNKVWVVTELSPLVCRD
jgi:hypothetical protein